MRVSQAHLDFIPKIYDTVVNVSSWQSTLDEFSHHCGASSAALFFGDHTFPEISKRVLGSRFNDLDEQTYTAQFGAEEMEAYNVVRTHPVQTWVHDEVGFRSPPGQIPSTLFQREAFGLDRRTACQLNETPIWYDGVSVHYEHGRDIMTKEENDVSRLFLPHLAKAVEISRPFALLQNRYQAVLSVLDFLQIGLSITNRNGEVIIKNREMNNILNMDNGVNLSKNNKLSFMAPEHKAELEAHIEAAVEASDRSKSDSFMIVPKRDGGQQWLLECFPLTNLCGDIDGQFKGAAIFVTDPDREDLISTKGLDALFQLTRAESEICNLLAKGKRIEEIADIRNVSPGTVRGQVKDIFGKTSVSSQSELVRLALKVNLPIELA